MDVKAIIRLQNETGTKNKQWVLKTFEGDEDFKELLYYALNPFLTYNLSETTLRKEQDVPDYMDSQPYADIFDCCEQLSKLKAADNATIRKVKYFLNRKVFNDEEREIYIKLLSKTLRLGVTAKTVNKIIPGLIPEWEVQQAYIIDKYPIPKGTEFWLTQKLNGVRATYYKGKLIARSGVPYKGLQHILDELSWINELGYVLDGELTLAERGGLSDNEAFRVSTGILNSDAESKTEICYTIFDAIPIADFESNKPSVSYKMRRIILNRFSSELNNPKIVSILPVLYHGADQSVIPDFLDQMAKEDKEGLMLNTDVPYKRTRHRGILKIKRFYTMDLPIIRVEEGSGRLAGTLGAVVVDYKGNEVKVGSGFSDEQRTLFWQHPEEIIGKLCEVKYKEISSDKNTGLESLQFPVFVRIRNDKTDVSYG